VSEGALVVDGAIETVGKLVGITDTVGDAVGNFVGDVVGVGGVIGESVMFGVRRMINHKMRMNGIAGGKTRPSTNPKIRIPGSIAALLPVVSSSSASDLEANPNAFSKSPIAKAKFLSKSSSFASIPGGVK